ncbi:flavin reductase family protein [Streptomyces sp. NPDC047043]|uniref:flavin reductase family protein n=1 Tax=Streptomyces sp. NPDC047043 TaxID=3154497 RepID=UPI0034031827
MSVSSAQQPETPAPSSRASGVTADRFRDVLGRFCSGVTVVTAVDGGEPVGMTCQSFMSLSLDPLLIAFAPALSSVTYPRIRRAGRFAISVLGEEQASVAFAFARSGTDKFAGVAWEPGITGAPLIQGAIAHIECHHEAEHEAGDHLLVVGRTMAVRDQADGRPLLFFRGAFDELGAGAARS